LAAALAAQRPSAGGDESHGGFLVGKNGEKHGEKYVFFALFSIFFIFCAAFEVEKVGDRLGYRGEII
jgi:hypothetical protein